VFKLSLIATKDVMCQAGGVAQVVELLPSKTKAQSSNPNTEKEKL
jgi:hypothetical protein